MTVSYTHLDVYKRQSKMYVAGSIGSADSKYVVALNAVNCQSGKTVAHEEMNAAGKTDVLDTIGRASKKLRAELGEPPSTVQKFDVPLSEATTPSLEALSTYASALKAYNEQGVQAALALDQHAIEPVSYTHLDVYKRQRRYRRGWN